MHLIRQLWQHGQGLLPIDGFHFDRPLVLVQSDDWARVGLRDQEGLWRGRVQKNLLWS